MKSAGETADEVARASYGKLVAILAARTGDLAAAEDALCEAFARALKTWPARGVPRNPEGWLITVAKNAHKDVRKSAAERTRADVPLEELDLMTGESVPDQRLALMFACAHPAINAAVRAPLMLQVILGLDVKVIATAYLMPQATLAQRLVRAKRKIKLAKIPIAVPDKLDARLPDVLEAIYAAAAIGWSDDDTALEALYLAQLVVAKLNTPSALGLCALLCFSAARRRARVDASGTLVPTSEQDPALWDRAFIDKGHALLVEASEHGTLDRFQLEAAIEDALSVRACGREVDRAAVAALYEGLVQIAPSIGAHVARAAAVGDAYGAAAGLTALEQVRDVARDYQPYWATRAHLTGAREDFERAIALTTSLRARRYLEKVRDKVSGCGH